MSDSVIETLHNQLGDGMKFYQLQPFGTIFGVAGYNFFKQIICNILIFVPLPCLMKISSPDIARYKVILGGMLCSISVELVQLLIDVVTGYPSHVCDIDDFILNSCGVILGYMLYELLEKIPMSNKLLKRFVWGKQNKYCLQSDESS